MAMLQMITYFFRIPSITRKQCVCLEEAKKMSFVLIEGVFDETNSLNKNGFILYILFYGPGRF